MNELSVTRALAESVAGMTLNDIPADARSVARHCLLDWFGCALAGSDEPLSRILVQQVAAASPGDSTLVGRPERTNVFSAALVNGAMSHALDFDDTHWTMNGHPSVPVIPAALALAERDARHGTALLAAIVAGIEAECRLGWLIGPRHYAAGFHATGTLGAFGAAAASAHILGLSLDQWCNAFGLTGTQAAGLKSGFGTMAKPLHAGRAAENGLLSALLARDGFTANPAIIETAQGFAATHAADPIEPARVAQLRDRYFTRETLFKYHASCYLTHAAIEAANQLRNENRLTSEHIASVSVIGSQTCVGVCDITEPQTGLEGKFSLRATTAMALLGDETSNPASFTDARMRDPDLLATRDRVTFTPRDAIPATRATVVVQTKGGDTLTAEADTGRPASDLDRQWTALSAKFRSLAEPVIGRDNADALYQAIEGIEDLPDVRDLAALVRATAAVS